MISDFEVISQLPRDFTNHTSCLDRLIKIGSLSYNPEKNVVEDSYINENVGLFLIHSSIFCQYFTISKSSYPIFPTLNRGMANNISRFVYDGIKELYLLCKSLVKIEYNTVNFNLAKSAVYKHTHKFASPNDVAIDTQVFMFKLTDIGPGSSMFKLHCADSINIPVSNCTFLFNGMLEHEVVNENDHNYYGYFVFERWPE